MKAFAARWDKLPFICMIWVSGVFFGSFSTDAGVLSWILLVFSLIFVPIFSLVLLDVNPNAPRP